MANTLGQPIVLDTVDTNLLPKPIPVCIKRVVWKAPTAAGDVLLLTDATDNPIVSSVAEVDGQSQTWLIEHTFDGLRLPTLTSGTVYIYRN